MIIDFHTHNFPEALAPRAVAVMQEKLEDRLTAFGDGTQARQLADMTAAGVDRAVVCPIATKPTHWETILRRSRAVMDGAEGEEPARRLTFLASVHPMDRDYAAHFRLIADAGIKGCTFHPYYQHFRLDDPRAWPIFAALRDAGLFAICHCGGDSGYPDAPMACGPCEIEALLANVPGLTFVASHLGGVNSNPDGAADRLLPYENCYFDTAVLLQDETRPEAQRIMREWPAERLVFGTDYFWRDEARLLAWARRHRPNPTDLEKILHLNAEKLLA